MNLLKRSTSAIPIILLILAMAAGPCQATDEVRSHLELLQDIHLEKVPLDLALSMDEKSVNVLVSGEILEISLGDGSIARRLSVDPSMDRLVRLALKDDFILSSSSTERIQILELKTEVELDPAERPFLGSAHAPVEVLVFSDYQCPSCARFEPILSQLLEQHAGDLKITFRAYPVRSHAEARPAAYAALAAFRQGRFEDYHVRLYHRQNELGPACDEKLARDLGLDLERFRRDFEDPELREMVERDLRTAIRIGVKAAPTLFVNGQRLSDWTVEGLQSLIESELAAFRKSAQERG